MAASAARNSTPVAAARDARVAEHPERTRDGMAHAPAARLRHARHQSRRLPRPQRTARVPRTHAPQREAERKARFEQRFTERDLNRDGKLGRTEVSEKLPRLSDRIRVARRKPRRYS
jgi:hypothetical protein